MEELDSLLFFFFFFLKEIIFTQFHTAFSFQNYFFMTVQSIMTLFQVGGKLCVSSFQYKVFDMTRG